MRSKDLKVTPDELFPTERHFLTTLSEVYVVIG